MSLSELLPPRPGVGRGSSAQPRVYLEAAGSPGTIFRDQTDLESGRSWVGQSQSALDQAEQLVLVVTPHSLASSRVAGSGRPSSPPRTKTGASTWPNWSRRRSPLSSPTSSRSTSGGLRGEVPPRASGARSRLLGRTGRPSFPLPMGSRSLLGSSRGFLPPCGPAGRGDRAGPHEATRPPRDHPRLGFPPERLETQPSGRCAASAAIVWATGDEAR